MKLQRNDFDQLIFDMDGVITSEYIYWDTAALTVYELLYSWEAYGKQDIDREWCRKNVQILYDTIFCGGKTVQAVKRLGVNTNWDLTYLVFCVSKYLDPELTIFDASHFESVCMFIENIEIQPPELYVGIEGLVATVIPRTPGYFKRSTGELWKDLQNRFRRWFLGDETLSGLKEREEPILPLKEIREVLQTLKNEGFRLGIGTGRPREEILYPLQMWGLDKYFDPKLCATYDEVKQAERETGTEIPLAKPHPFVFLKAAFGERFSDEELCRGAVPPEMAGRCLVIGDAPSDLLAARAGGFPFAAVLTGIEGKGARTYFEENHADMIWNSILDLGEENEN